MIAKQIDWEEIQRRIDSAGAALASGSALDAEERRRILKRRAAILALEPDAETVGDSIEIVEFLLANEHYGIASQWISEVYPLKDLTPLPGVPSFVLGLVNVRGRILSVIDLKKFFEIPDKGLSDLNKIIILEDQNMAFGILADAIIEVRNIEVSAIGPPLPTLTGIREEYLKGVTSERVVILDAARILADKNIVVHDEV